jgi:hypothetical protein
MLSVLMDPKKNYYMTQRDDVNVKQRTHASRVIFYTGASYVLMQIREASSVKCPQIG